MINFVSILWALVWGGMFADPGILRDWTFLTGLFHFVQGARSLLPILAAYISLLWILVKRVEFPFIRMPLGFLFAYCVIGLATSIFLSPDKFISLYYGLAYLAPLLVLWTAFEKERTVDLIGSVMIVNEIVVYGVLFALLPEVIRVGTVYNRFSQIFNLPFGLGEMRANGVGRFAMTAIILAFIRLVTTRRKIYKLVWFAPIAAGLFILAQSRSRSSLLGLAVCSVLFVLIWGLDWRLILVGPMSAYVIWLSAIKWRLHGHVEGLMNLTGRDTTWQKGLEQLKESPFLGWGFHADRLMLDFEHMHNSYLHSAMQAGIVGAILFAAAFVSTWVLILKAGLFARIKTVGGKERVFLAQSVLLVGFMTARSFFESTAAFYGVDLLLFVPAACYIYAWIKQNPEGAEKEEEPPAAAAASGNEQERSARPWRFGR